MGQMYPERATGKSPSAALRCCRDLGGGSVRATGDRATLLCANGPGMSPDLPSQEAEKSPALKLAFPTPFFFRSHLPVLVSGRCQPQRRAGCVAPSRGRPPHPVLGRGRFPSCTPLPSFQLLRLHPITFLNSMGAESLPLHPGRALPSLGPAGQTLTHCCPCGLGTRWVPAA